MFCLLSSFLSFSIAVSAVNSSAFISNGSRRRHVSISSQTHFSSRTSTMAKSRSLPDLKEVDKDGKAVLIPVKSIERDWKWKDDYKAEGEFSADLFLPEDRNIKGCAFFMHGFSQYPIAYRETLKDAAEKSKVAIIAVETGVSSKIVLKDTLNRPKGMSRITWSQFVLQRAVSEDTKQCIRMVTEGDSVFEDYGVTKSSIGTNIAVMGHSMGGGLSFPVAADCHIDYVFTMAPAYGVDDFEPIPAVKKWTATNSMLLSGGWDLLAPAKKVKEIAAKSNTEDNDSSISVFVKQGLHTGFQDQLVLLWIPLSRDFNIVEFIWKNILGFAEVFLFQLVKNILSILDLNKKRLGQLDGTRALMDYFLESMVNGEKITVDGAEKYMDDVIKDRYEGNFIFSYPEESPEE